MDAGVRVFRWRSPAVHRPHLQARGFLWGSNRVSPGYCEHGRWGSSMQYSCSLQRTATTYFKMKNDEGKGGDEVKLCHVSCFFHVDDIQINELQGIYKTFRNNYFQSLRYVTLTVVLNPLYHGDREKCVLRV